MNLKVSITAMTMIAVISFFAGLIFDDECVDGDCHEVQPTPTIEATPIPTPEPIPTSTPEPSYSCVHSHGNSDTRYIHYGKQHLSDYEAVGVYSDYTPEKCGHE